VRYNSRVFEVAYRIGFRSRIYFLVEETSFKDNKNIVTAGTKGKAGSRKQGRFSMRKTMILAGTVLVLGLVFVGCDNNGNGGGIPPVVNPPAPAPGAEELSLTGRVYTVTWGSGLSPSLFTPFPTGQNRTVTGLGATGAIANGQLSFTIGTPSTLWPIESELWFPAEEYVTFDPSSAQAIELWLSAQAPGGSGELALEYFIRSISGNSFNQEWVYRRHIFVDRDVTVRLAQDRLGVWEDVESGNHFSETYTIRAFTLTLRQGWNVVHHRGVATGTFVGSVANPTSVTTISTITVSTADPGRQLRWVLDEWDWDDYSETLELSRGVLPSSFGTSPFRARRGAWE